MRRRAFSMIELMVVIGIVALISSITLGTFRTVANGNRKTSCQSNMAQIYGALRLYAQDYNGRFPLLNATTNDIMSGGDTIAAGAGIGLWSLYSYGNPKATFSGTSDRNGVSFPILTDDAQAGYLKSTKVFHCPNDDFNYSNGQTTLPTTQIQETDSTSGNTYYNPAYLSYQSPPNQFGPGVVDDLTGTPVYSSFRKDGKDASADTRSNSRQLVYYEKDTDTSLLTAHFDSRPADNTVVMWCRFHRKLKSDGTVASTTDTNNYDNVLFADGSVQYIQSIEPVAQNGGTSSTCIRGWDRVPNSDQYALPDAAAKFCTG